jgi:hypothetical protein
MIFNRISFSWCQWSLPGILVAESFLQSTWAICVGIFQGKLVSILVVDSQICLFHKLRFVSVFCIIFVTCYTRKTALFRATQIFQKVTKVVVNSQINVSFSPALIWLSLKLVSILVVDSQICLFHKLRFFSVFCIIFVTLDSFLGDRYFVVTCYYIGWVNQ